MFTSYYLPLNRTSLLLLHPQHPNPKQRPIVVQITTKMANERVVDEMTQFYLSHKDITKAIENLLCAHISTPVPRQVEIEGDGFLLRGSHKPWSYGRTISIKWGDQNLQPADDKWTFVIHVKY
ncbi:hypothetical protein Agabi119p4_9415 [Agaricus bisporus var. burnettii]|uniref:Uncharacterized protein n=1 Tax=Agaricus bisporus var. burnettii TaxID=192524 RepID=A0A8H7EWN0_AGABI|nr:hypothetical protein Agabi119p4_9415 [Agaricus bisporus var. burnettii]